MQPHHKLNLEIRIKNYVDSIINSSNITNEDLLNLKEKIKIECKHMSNVGRFFLTSKTINWLSDQIFMTSGASAGFGGLDHVILDEQQSIQDLNISDIAVLADMFLGTPLGDALNSEYNRRLRK